MNLKLVLLIFNLCFISVAFAQQPYKHAWHWYFGVNAGLDFSSGEPVADTTGSLVSIEGSAVMSDENGELLFYTNGQTVWQKNHQVMPNGEGLLGHPTSIQSSIIVPRPGHPNQFYLLTTGGVTYPEGHGLKYNLIDMALNNGMGDVTGEKNIELYETGGEDLSATLHCNGIDYWIIGREHTSNGIHLHVFKITENGVEDFSTHLFLPNLHPWVVSSSSFSQDGSQFLFSSLIEPFPVVLFDFDTNSGELTLRELIQTRPEEMVYSVSFSPDQSKCYMTSWINGVQCYLSQFDLSSDDITASRFDLDSIDFSLGSPNAYGFIGKTQLAPDQRIYVSRWKQDLQGYSLDSLDAIRQPNLPGALCDFQRNAVFLNGKATQIGLPNFVSNYTGFVSEEEPCEPLASRSASGRAEFTVSPNPFAGTLFIHGDHPNPSALTFKLFDALGRTIPTEIRSFRTPIELTSSLLPAGVYFLSIAEEGDLLQVVKVIAR